MSKIAMCSAEAVPFAKTGGLADVMGSLPQALEKLDNRIIVIIPGYEELFLRFKNIRKIAENLKIATNPEKDDFFDIYKADYKKISYFFIRNTQYFSREGLYGTPGGDYDDNNLRFGFFSKALFGLLKQIGFKPDILHLHDYHVALASLFLHNKKSTDGNDFFKNTKTVFTIHNLAYQGIYGPETLELLDIDRKYFNMNGIEFYGKVNFMKSGIVYSDKVTTVSPTYAREILTPEFGYGMDGVLKTRENNLQGIINGLDYELWNPEKDKDIISQYGPADKTGKIKCKKMLLGRLFKNADSSKPVFGMVSRLSEQKGFDILAEAIENILREDLYFIVAGTGDAKYRDILSKIKNNFGDKLSLNLTFSDKLSREIYAGSDFFVMPSKYEPCGLGQLIALRYGTIPLARKTGGLADTIFDVRSATDIDTGAQGFLFHDYSAQNLYDCIKRALSFFHNDKYWPKLIDNAMSCNFSWDNSAKKYNELFNSIL